MKYNALIAALFITISAPSLAAINRVVDGKRPPNTVKSVKVFFTGVVTLNKVMSLSSALDEIGQNYKSATQVLLYISSPGGDIDAGKIGYQVVKNSPIPVTTVNASSVESSATMIYCGAQKRQVMGDSIFLLHAPTVGNAPRSNVSENMLDEKTEFTSRYRNVIKTIYQSCTHLTDEQIEKITYSEDNHKLLDNKQALATGIATGEMTDFQPADAAYYIHDND